MKKYYYKSLFAGFYGVCAERGFRDGFLNRCRKDCIPVWKLKNIGKDKLYFCVPCEFFEKIRENADASGMEVKITGFFGLFPFMKKNKDRAFLFSGIVLTIFFLAFMSGRIWNISVKGNEKVFSSEIISVCEELGVKEGSRKSKIDVQEFQRSFIEKMGDRIIWVSINIEGMCAEIEVREIVKTQDDAIEKPCNYIADFDGVIKLYRVYSGTPMIEKGSGVHKGDLLISGVIDHETGSSSFTEASGKITALHSVDISGKNKKKIKVRTYTKTKKYYSLSLFGFEIKPFGIGKENAEITEKRSHLEINGVTLPFYIGIYSLTFYHEEETSDNDFLKRIALSDYLSCVRSQFKNSVVISNKEKYKDGYVGSFEVIDYIGKKSVIMLENE